MSITQLDARKWDGTGAGIGHGDPTGGLIAKINEIITTLNEQTGAGGSQADLILDAATELTIAGGVVTATQGFHTIDTQGDAASDDLDTISGVAAGEVAIFKPANDARTVVVKHGTGNILCPHGKDISLAEDDDHILVVGTGTKVVVVGFKTDAGNGGGAGAMVGALSSLTTTDKTSIVNAINELVTQLGKVVFGQATILNGNTSVTVAVGGQFNDTDNAVVSFAEAPTAASKLWTTKDGSGDLVINIDVNNTADLKVNYIIDRR